MTPTHLTAAIRERLRVEARDRCGYCRTQQSLAYASLEVDHIVPVVAGGGDEADNLWLACRPCNQYKGTQVYGEDPHTGRRVRLFNPRRQIWRRHFAWSEDGTHILGLTVCGRATVVALRLNNPFAVETRGHWVRAGWHPPRDERLGK
jgi:hypothetical protein